MTDQPQQPTRREQFGPVLKWTLFAFMLGWTAITAETLSDTGVPGAPVTVDVIATGAMCIACLLSFPPVSKRLALQPTKRMIIGGSLAVVLGLGAISMTQGAIEDSPARQTARLASLEAEAQRLTDEGSQGVPAGDQEAQKRQLAACFGTFSGTISELRDRVRDSMNDPSSFEHVSTAVDFNAENNILMTFRAKNAFNAIMLGSVRAKIDPDTCKIESIENATAD